jgi:3'(2'), 5'-bisphosphate nucleotidase
VTQEIPQPLDTGLADALTALVAQASAAILAIAPAALATRLKADHTPVTAADEAADAVIAAGLARLLPGMAIVSEEGGQRADAPGDTFVLVDPLDGTKEYIAGRDEYTVNVAVVRNGAPIAGVVCAPGKKTIWRGLVGKGAERLHLHNDKAQGPEKIAARKWPSGKPVAAVSRSHLDPKTEAFLAKLGPVDANAAGSSVKFCRIAEGVVDVYPRLGTTCEWDIAAGHAVLAAAGGVVTDPNGGALRYGNVAGNFRVPSFLAWGDPAKARAV